MNFGSSDFLKKHVNLFSCQHVGAISVVSKVLPKRNCPRFMSTTDTHLILSDLALAIWSLMVLVNGETLVLFRLFCVVLFVICNSFHTCMRSVTRQARLDSLTYFQLLFSATSDFSLKFLPEIDWNFVKTSLIRTLDSFSDSNIVFYRAVNYRRSPGEFNCSSSSVMD